MANIFGTLVNAVNTATSPEARQAATNALATAIADAVSRGEGVGVFLQAALGLATAPLGAAQLAAIGNLQRYLADVACGAVAPTPQALSSIIAQLIAVFGAIDGGQNLPGLPGLPPWPVPGLPFQIPQIPGLDACKFIKCLASSIDCSGATDSGVPGKGGDVGDEIARMVGSGIEILKRARDFAEEKVREADRAAKDLAAAAEAAPGEAKAEIEQARKQAEAKANNLRAKADKVGETIGGAIANSWPI